MLPSSNIHDVTVIGAGPAGLSCAIEAKRAGLNCIVIDKGSIVNGIQQYQQNMYFFSTPELLEIGDIPFVVPTTRPTSLDCVNYYRCVAEHYQLNLRLYEKIISLKKSENTFTLQGESGQKYESKSVIVATGYYDTPNPLNVPGENLSHVSHYYHTPLPYFQQDVLIVGGKNSAVEAALDLWRHGARVTVVHRGEKLSGNVKYWILPDFENRVSAGAITMLFNSTVREFQSGKTLIQHTNGRLSETKTDFAFILIGYRPDVPFLKSLGITVDSDTLAPAHNPETFETNIPGLFVAGGMVGGRFNNKVFIENGREHGKRIVKSILKKR
jgi:thioredoxin reductase (NADPH)